MWPTRKSSWIWKKFEHFTILFCGSDYTKLKKSCCFLRLLDCISLWTERACYVEMVHCTLRGDTAGHTELSQWMCARFQHLELRKLTEMDYVTALSTAKSSFQHIPRKLLRPALEVFLQRTLNYLSPGVVIGVGR